MPLAGSCVAGSGVNLTYVVGGGAVTSITCPAANASVSVAVRPAFGDRPDCSYNTTAPFNVTSEQKAGVPAVPFCADPPQHMLQPVRMATTTLSGSQWPFMFASRVR